MAGVLVKDLYKRYNTGNQIIDALHGMNLSVEDGSFITIVGKSGCGKTTLLRILCGLEEKTEGEITFYSNQSDNCNPNIGMIFQEPRLMPWLTVEENMAFSLVNTGHSGQIRQKVNKCLDMLDLTSFRDAYPSQISGGMAQRTALGRTLCYEPDLILMDEPLGALDAFNRRKLQDELVKIIFSNRKTVVFVTHDVDEAVYLGQKVLVMNEGRVECEIPVDLPYPRDIKSMKSFHLREEILRNIMKKPETKILNKAGRI